MGPGVPREPGAAFLVEPLVQVAWADGEVRGPKREVIFDLAAQRGIAPGTPAHGQLLAWLKMRPSADLFDAALDALRAGFAVLPAAEREARIRSVLDACVRVAEARGTVARVLSLPSATSAEGSAVLDDLERKLEMACPSVPDG